MKRRIIGIGLTAMWVALSAVPKVEAREYLINQGYDTAEKGEFEVELYNDINFADMGNEDTYNSKHQIEFEVGATDHLQLAYYEVYTWDRTNDWERDAFKVETKLRLGEAGKWPLDVALYTEYKNPNGRRQTYSDVFENKVILSKEIGPWNLVGNFVFEKKIYAEEPWEYEVTVGANYAVTQRTRLSIEVKQGLGDSDDFGFSRNRECLVVPGIYTRLTEHVRLLIGSAFGLTRVSDDVQLKSILEVEF